MYMVIWMVAIVMIKFYKWCVFLARKRAGTRASGITKALKSLPSTFLMRFNHQSIKKISFSKTVVQTFKRKSNRFLGVFLLYTDVCYFTHISLSIVFSFCNVIMYGCINLWRYVAINTRYICSWRATLFS